MDRWRSGEPISASKLNNASAAVQPQEFNGGAFVKESGRSAMILNDVAGTESFWVTPDEEYVHDAPLVSGRTLYHYSWTEVILDPQNGQWSRNEAHVGHYDIDPVQMPDPTTRLMGDSFSPDKGTYMPEVFAKVVEAKKVYHVVRDAFTGTLTVVAAGSNGSFEAKSNSIILLLGTYDQYKDCPGVKGVASAPPKKPDGTLCGNYYAWAEYAVCGYRMKKLRDMRTFPYWAQTLNNPTGSPSGLRRLYNAFFGNPQGNCQGVRFDCGCNIGNLDCVCPDWMSPVKCLMLKFKTIPRPCPVGSPDPWCGYGNCAAVMQNMDDNNMWDQEYTMQLCGASCNFAGTLGATGWGADLHFQPAYTNTTDHCFWGPDWLDPCNPCEGFGEFSLSITSGDKRADCAAAGVITGWFTDIEMKDLVENCKTKKPYRVKQCNNCQDASSSSLHFVVPESVEIYCCTPKNVGTCP